MWNIRREKSQQFALPAYGLSYFNTVRAELNAIPRQESDEASKTLRENAEKICQKEPHLVTWADVFALEVTVARMQPAERLRRRICILREKYQVLVGDASYKHYLECAATDLQKASIEELRAEIETLLSEFHWVYSASKTRDTLFGELRTKLIVPILVYGAIVIVYAWSQILVFHSNIPTLAIVILAGVVGSFTSIMRRLQLAQAQPISNLDDPIVGFSQLGLGGPSVLLALTSGAVFSTVLYLVFIGTFLQGTIFPAIYTPEGAKGISFLAFTTDTEPKGGVEYAKLLVWSFISGFGERFVPDVLDRLTTKGSSAAGTALTPANNPPMSLTPPVNQSTASATTSGALAQSTPAKPSAQP